MFEEHLGRCQSLRTSRAHIVLGERFDHVAASLSHVLGHGTGAQDDRGKDQMVSLVDPSLPPVHLVGVHEVGEIPVFLQGKLLRVLQDGEYSRVGEDDVRTVDVRIIAATNRDLQREVTRLQNEFREDLNLRQNEELGLLQRSLLKEVQDYAAQEGYDLIVGDGVLYASNTVNITEAVLRAVEANFQATGAR